MGKLVTPRTFLLGYSQVDLTGLTDYLKYTEQTGFLESFEAALQDGLSPAEALCSFYAKLCYKSLTVGKNTNITRVRDVRDNLVNALAHGHGCYDIETEVLTDSGWKEWPDVTSDDRLATRTTDGVIEYHKPSKLISYEHSGRMYRVEAENVDLLVTPDHNMLICYTTTKTGRKRNDFSLVKAEDIGAKSHCYIKIGTWLGDNGNTTWNHPELSPPVARLLGFAIGDGNKERTSSRLKFHLRRERKIVYLRSLAASLGWGELKQDNHDNYSITIPVPYLALFNDIYTENKEKQIPNGLLLNHGSETLLHLLDGLIQSDGSTCGTCDIYDTASPRLAGQFQQLCLHVGLASNEMYTYEPTPNSQIGSKFGVKPLTRLSVITKKHKPEVNSFSKVDGRGYFINDWSGTVYCAEVPNHTLYVRRNGIPVWSGNSIFEHVNLNFVITDCSRVLTHEICRHRIGTAFSQTSGRYCRLDHIDLVWDPILDGCEDLAQELLEQIETTIYLMECQKNLRTPPADHPNASPNDCLSDGNHGYDQKRTHLKWVPNDNLNFDYKKKITSAIRRLAPNGQTNEMGFSINLRALRQVVQVRTSEGAEREIRLVFNQIYELVANKFPMIFHGCKIKEVDGLKVIYGMKCQPYEIEAGNPDALKHFNKDQLQQAISTMST